MSRTVRQEVREQGALKRMSVAVALNQTAPPRGADELARITTLVKSAVGFNEARGDKVEVVEIAFSPDVAAATAEGAGAPAPALMSSGDVMRLGELGVLSVIGLSLIVFVVRPLLFPKPGAPLAQIAMQRLGDAAGMLSVAPSLPAPAFDQKIDLARVEGQVRASSVNKVSEVVRGHTDESIGILKNWIGQAS
jgi:flagellar M-ring protein FliF